MKTKILLSVFVLSCTIASCGNPADQLEKKLSAIQNVEDEKSVFVEIRKVFTGAIIPYDKDQKRLDFSQIDFTNNKWWSSIHTIKFYPEEGEVTYQVIDPQNVFILVPDSIFKGLKEM